MPYLLRASSYTTSVALLVESPRLFRLETPLAYRLSDIPDAMNGDYHDLGLAVVGGKAEIEVPAFSETPPPTDPALGQTDLATIPPMLWGVIGPYGRHLLAALVHDYLCQHAETFGSRAFADYVFWRACRDSERVDRPQRPDGSQPSTALPRSAGTRALLLWAGVSVGRLWAYRKLSVLWLVLALAGGITALVQALAWVGRNNWLGGLPGWLWWAGGLLMGAAALATLIAGKIDLPAVLSGLFRVFAIAGGLGLLVAAIAAIAGLLAPLPPLTGVLAAGWGLAAFVAGSLALLVKTPTKRDAFLPLIALLALLVLLPVAAVTVFAQCLLWVPDALEATVTTLKQPNPDNLKPVERLKDPSHMDTLDDLARYGN
jgi:hypothetical protein